MFKFQLWLAQNFGFWKYDGLWGCEPSSWPRARVQYPPEPTYNFPGGVSKSMVIGNAVDYAEVFNGTVIPN